MKGCHLIKISTVIWRDASVLTNALNIELQCTNSMDCFIFSDLIPYPSTQTDICFTALEHYANMYIFSLWRESVLMGLNRASGEGNLTASDECPVTYVSLSHTQVDMNVVNAGKRVDLSLPGVG